MIEDTARRRISLFVVQCAAGAIVAAGSSATLAGESLDFDRVFRSAGEAPQFSYSAVYRTAGVDHRLDVWRDGEARLKRRTDDAIETYVFNRRGDAEWTMSVLDLKRRVRTNISRTDLLRIGHYTDWFAQAHALTRPRAAYRLTPSSALAGASPVAPCRWYRLVEHERSTTICWSRQAAVPLVLANADGEVVWRITRLDRQPFAIGTFAIDSKGFVRHDAADDIEAD